MEFSEFSVYYDGDKVSTFTENTPNPRRVTLEYFARNLTFEPAKFRVDKNGKYSEHDTITCLTIIGRYKRRLNIKDV